MTFSSIVWEKNRELYDKILNMSFNKKLLDGSLDKEIFAYYIEQDALYLKYYSKALAIIAAKLDNAEDSIKFLNSAMAAHIVEQEVVHKYFKNLFKSENTNKITTANIAYTSYLLSLSYSEPVEVAIAGILPCFWIYNEIGKNIKELSTNNHNPYKQWIDTYADEEFSKSTYQMIQLTDNLYNQTTDTIKEKMITAFNNAFVFEFRFFYDAYNMDDFNDIL